MFAQLDRDILRLRPAKVWTRLVAYLMFEGRPLTTRGRFINPMVFALFRLWAVLPLSPRPPCVVLILGVGRSGTTLLGSVLGLSRRAGFLNEPKALWQAALGDDDLVGSYSATPGRFRMTATDAEPSKVRKLRRFYRAFATVTASRVIIDKYPELIFRSGFIARALPGAYAVVILRDGWQTAASIAAWSARHGTVGQDWWGKDDRKWHLLVDQIVRPDPYFKSLAPVIGSMQDQANRAAIEWLATTREALRLRRCGAEGFAFVRFEDLVADPAATLEEICAFCGLATDPAVIGYARARIRPPRRYPRPSLHPTVDAMVAETMDELGYGTAMSA